MTNVFKHFLVERDVRNVVAVTVDVQGSPVNIFADEVVQELIEIVNRLEQEPPRAIVFKSNKPTGFLAGADVKRIQRIPTEEEARAVQSVGQQLFDRIENLPCPTIAAIHGVCLGGGLEFALSCRYRVAKNDSQTKIGLPEVLLGLIPGWGGTQRLPKLVGLRQALRMILEGSSLSAAKAAAIGLVDLATGAETFESELKQFVEDRLSGKPTERRSRGLVGALLEGTGPGRNIVLSIAKKKLGSRGRDYPALNAALRAISAGFKGGHAAGLAAERAEFPPLLFGPVSRNLIDVFFRREQARKPSTWVSAEHSPRKVRKAAVVGAGTMGAGIAQLLAFNGISVVLKDVNDQITAAGKKKVETLTADAVAKGAISRGEAEAVLKNVTATSEWGPLTDADLVIEAVVEREDIKREVFRQLAEKLTPNAVLASNTSALSVSRLAQGIANPGRVAGLHFFNPVHKMHLVEVIRGQATDDDSVATLVDLVRKLGKVPIVVADSPGFLVNRILFPYLDEAVRLVMEGVSGEEVDREAVRFGMPMGPLELLDQVGIDVATDVAGTLGKLRNETGPTPERLASMAKEGSTGQKSGRGFYTYEGGKRGNPTHWATPSAVKQLPASPVDACGMTVIQTRLIYPMINEAVKCLDGVVNEAWAVDLGMVLGTGFAPFRGGPLHVADAIGLPLLVNKLEDLARSSGSRYEPCPLLKTMAAEQRTFFPTRSEKPVAAAVAG
ncbi:MAG TPA: 3-hydroxyacyl-CoA dehydrogenase NAD-binding domain-containing protein [Gemmata sp.]|nr:3-hydroxyacyl-CoA dehydrogenase NAD-binding domain-containing protein [Gemmata sp.]